MAGFSSMRELVDAEENGYSTLYSWRKVVNVATPTGVWFDLSMSPGNPSPQYYADSPLVSVQMSHTLNGGLYHGKTVENKQKVVRQILGISSSVTPLPMPIILCDYLLYYPFIDETTTSEQLLNNSLSLSRYGSGAGVMIMAISVAGRTGGAGFSINYTNSDGVANRVTRIVLQNSVSLNGNIVTSQRATDGNYSPFIPLQIGDSGVRSIQSVTMTSEDVGLFTLVLVKPICQMFLREQTAPVENDYFLDFSQLPIIQNDAYLNFICCPLGSLSGVSLMGTIKTAWN